MLREAFGPCITGCATRFVEPPWKMLLSNKAILPVLWELFPDHPNLLASTWEPTAAMRADGYVTKPVSGRGGAYPVSAYPTRLHPSARDRCAIISNALVEPPTGFRAALLEL